MDKITYIFSSSIANHTNETVNSLEYISAIRMSAIKTQ